MTSNPDNPWVGTWWIPTLLLASALVIVAWIWKYGSRLEMTRGGHPTSLPESSRVA
jgi:hypothetical protein